MAYDPETVKARQPNSLALTYGLVFTALGLLILAVEWPNLSLLPLYGAGGAFAVLWREVNKRWKRRAAVSDKSDSM